MKHIRRIITTCTSKEVAAEFTLAFCVMVIAITTVIITVIKMLQRFCVVCGLEIPLARLEAKPDATMCVKCASKNDKPYTATLAPDPDAPHPRGW